jgi:hypothetical protein
MGCGPPPISMLHFEYLLVFKIEEGVFDWGPTAE